MTDCTTSLRENLLTFVGTTTGAGRCAALALSLALAVSLVACGGGGDASSQPQPQPQPTLNLTSNATAAVLEGSAPVSLTLGGATSATGAIGWSLSPLVGSLSSTSMTGAIYTPPAAGSLNADTTVTVTVTPAAGGAASTQIAIKLIAFGVKATAPSSAVATVDTQPSVTFTRDVSLTSLTSSSFSISGPIGAVPASISASGPTASITPTRGLVWGTHYNVSLTTQVTSAVNQTLPAAVTFGFDIPAAAWLPAAPIASPSLTTGSPVVASDAHGHGFAIWQQDTDGTGTWNIFASVVDIRTHTAGVPIRLSTPGSAAYAPAIAANEAGDAIAVWTQNSNPSAYAARYDHATGLWGAAAAIEPPSTNGVQSPQIAMDASGNALVVWQQYTGIGLLRAVSAQRYDAAADTWGTRVLLSSADDATAPQVAFDAAGNAMAAWTQGASGTTFQPTVSRWSASTQTWSTPSGVQLAAGGAFNPQLAVAANGDAALAWSQDQLNGMIGLEVSRFSAANATWSTAQPISGGTGTSNWGQVKMDPAGNILLLWQQIHGANVYSLNAARYSAASGTWNIPPAIEGLSPASFANPYSYAPTLVVDAAGNATAIWQRDIGGSVFNLYYARYDSLADTWGPATPVQGAGLIAGLQSASVDQSGNVLVGWGETLPGTSIVNPYFALLTGY